MLTAIEKCNTLEMAWALLPKIINDILCPVSRAIKADQKDLPAMADKAKRRLIDRLGTLAHNLEMNSHTEDGQKVDHIRTLVLRGDLADSAVIEKIHEVVNDLVGEARTIRSQ